MIYMSVEGGGYQPDQEETQQPKSVAYRVSYDKAEKRPYLQQEEWLEAARPELESERIKPILNTVRVTERMYVTFKSRVFRMLHEHGMASTPKTEWHRTEREVFGTPRTRRIEALSREQRTTRPMRKKESLQRHSLFP